MLARFSDPRRGGPSPERRANRRGGVRTAAACVSAIAVVSVAACGSSSGSADSSDSATAAPGQTANVEAAKQALARYTVPPTSFPVTYQLTQKLPAGKKFVYLQCSTPICAAVGTIVRQAVTAIGGTFTVVNAGSTAQTAQAAASSVNALKPDAVLLGAIDPALFGGGLKKLSDNGAKLVSLQIAKDVKPYGITFNYLGADLSRRNGKLLADWVIAREGTQADTVLYTEPALDISALMQKSFQAEMKAQCPSCKVRVVPIDVSTIGTTAPRTVVTDLQAHKGTKAAVFVSLSAAAGLPAAMKAAGLSVTTVGFGPTAGNLQDIKNGSLTAALNIDFPVSTWTAVDAAARLLEGGEPTASEQAGEVPEQFLEKNDITFDPTRGWSAFPDYAKRFAQLWRLS